MLKLLLFITLFIAGSAFSQRFDFKNMNKDSLQNIHRYPILRLEMTEKDEFRVPGVEGKYQAHKDSLKKYILENKEKSNISVNKKASGYNFDKYRKCFFEVAKIYEQIWNEQASKRFNKKFEECSTEEKEEITKVYPVKFG
ncbi:MAG: hypothetical protein R2799_01960 [Crocinitomicaceae bacterium]